MLGSLGRIGYLGAICALLLPLQAFAKGGERLANLKQLCIADQGVGFNWREGRWQSTVFKPEKFVVTKITPPQSPSDIKEGEHLAYLRCTLDFEDREELSSMYNSCLRVQEVGDASPTFMACYELHLKSNNQKEWRVTFQCNLDNFYFDPNGNYHSGSIHQNVEDNPENDYKDSLGIYVGKCADISD